MTPYSDILDWKLRSGSHEFPGPEGGTCINEAAIVAAGFAYRGVASPRDLPACFCPVVSEFSVWLNDHIPDDKLRMRLLLPFIMRLAGAKGSGRDETARIEMLRAHLRHLLPAKHRKLRFTRGSRGHLVFGDIIGGWVTRRFTIATAADVRELVQIAEFVERGLGVADLPGFYADLAHALEAMLDVGPQADPLTIDLVAERMENARARAA